MTDQSKQIQPTEQRIWRLPTVAHSKPFSIIRPPHNLELDGYD